MSMPGWEFTIRCERCELESESYPLMPFSQSFTGDLTLPAWSTKLGCFAAVALELSYGQRRAIESTPGALAALAAELSTPALTVGAPTGLAPARITPAPVCPRCGNEATVRSSLDAGPDPDTDTDSDE